MLALCVMSPKKMICLEDDTAILALSSISVPLEGRDHLLISNPWSIHCWNVCCYWNLGLGTPCSAWGWLLLLCLGIFPWAQGTKWAANDGNQVIQIQNKYQWTVSVAPNMALLFSETFTEQSGRMGEGRGTWHRKDLFKPSSAGKPEIGP